MEKKIEVDIAKSKKLLQLKKELDTITGDPVLLKLLIEQLEASDNPAFLGFKQNCKNRYQKMMDQNNLQTRSV